MSYLLLDKNNNVNEKDKSDNYVVVKKDCVLINTLISNDDPYKTLQTYMVEEISFE